MTTEQQTDSDRLCLYADALDKDRGNVSGLTLAMRQAARALDALVAERDALAARLAEAERQASDDRAELRYWRQKRDEAREAAEARVAALTAELREALLSIEAYAEVGGVLVHETTNGWRLLAAADRPEGTPPQSASEALLAHLGYERVGEATIADILGADRPEGTTPQEGNA